MTDASPPERFQFADGESYERFMGRWSRMVGEGFLDWLVVPRDLAWLDVGCGNGAFTETLIARCAPSAVAAIDPSEGQLAYARTRESGRQAHFERADAQALPFADDNFDVVVMALVLAFLPDAPKAAREMMRTLRPGGLGATYMWDMPAGAAPVSPVAAAAAMMGMPRPPLPGLSYSSQNAMAALWRAAGFQEVETHAIGIPVRFENFEDFWISNSGRGSPTAEFIAGLSTDRREELRKRVRALLPLGADGSIVCDCVANAVKGHKPR